MQKISLKSESDIKSMHKGGQKLAAVRNALGEAVKPGVTAWEIEELANELIDKHRAKASFKMVPGYSWATCINVNSGVVHGIPKKEVVFKKGDVVSVDVGVFYEGFHTDTALTVYLGNDPDVERFLKAGKDAVESAINVTEVGGKIGDISEALETSVVKMGYSPIKSLTGHGVGRNLHEDPRIPCFVSGSREEKVELVAGMTLAIEIMYTQGTGDIMLDNDGWTIRTKDAKIAALFEETVALTRHGRIILTR